MNGRAIAVVAVLLAGCGGTPEAASPVESMSSVPEPTDAPMVDTSAPAATSAPTAAPETPPTPAPTAEAKPTCDKLPKGTCKVTRGCAWNDKPPKCVVEAEAP